MFADQFQAIKNLEAPSLLVLCAYDIIATDIVCGAMWSYLYMKEVMAPHSVNLQGCQGCRRCHDPGPSLTDPRGVTNTSLALFSHGRLGRKNKIRKL